MSKAQAYHVEYRSIFMDMARRFPRNADVYASLARHHNRQALYVARLNQARQQAQSVSR